MVTTGEQLPYQGQILVSNSPVRYSPVSNSPYPAKNRQTTQSQKEAPRIPLPQLIDDPLDPVQAWADLYTLTAQAKPCDPLLLVPSLTGSNYVLDQRRRTQTSIHSLRHGPISVRFTLIKKRRRFPLTQTRDPTTSN